MNERIRELAEHCYVKTGSVHTDHFAYWKFAELIIRECAKQVEGYYQEDHSFGLDAAYIIKQHFGME